MYYLSFFIILLLYLTYSVSTHSKLIALVDSKVLGYLHFIQSKSFDMFFSTITWLGSLWVLLPLYVGISFYLLSLGLKNLVYATTIGFLGAIATTYSIKYILDRKRPEYFDTIGDLPFDPSFPSGHTTQAFIFVFLLIFILWQFDVVYRYIYISTLVTIAILVAISRMYLQVHFFSDIVAGILVASIWIYLSVMIFRTKGGL